jgi:hypothetical protein
MDKIFYVYQLTDFNNIPFYIGKGMKKSGYDRICYHKHHWQKNINKKLVNKIKKLSGKFNFKILMESQNEKKCLNLEKRIIKEIGKENLCNLTDGGDGISGYNHTIQDKKKMSILAKNDKKRIEIAKRNYRKAAQMNKGKRKLLSKHNEVIELYKTKSILEICDILNISFSCLKKYLVEKGFYIKNKNRKPIPEELRKKLSLAHIGLLSPAVIQYDKQGKKIREFKSASDASKFVRGERKYGNYICHCCNGHRKSAFGYKWRYK